MIVDMFCEAEAGSVKGRARAAQSARVSSPTEREWLWRSMSTDADAIYYDYILFVRNIIYDIL
jgi:hypothetical protein